MAAPVVGAPAAPVTTRARFYKMTGSGNDFVIFDAREEPIGALEEAPVVSAICARAMGVGADGVVFLVPSERPGADFRMRYLNSDGSPAVLCGNAALCVTRLAALLGAGRAAGMHIETDSGLVAARMREGTPEVDLPQVDVIRADVGFELGRDERRIGYATAGVPHLVVECTDAREADVLGRGAVLRRHPSLAEGANVNFVSPNAGDGSWTIRTFERGVEGETLACGTGAVATAVLLATWGASVDEATLVPRSGRRLRIRLRRAGSAWLPTLAGEGRLVYTGELGEV